MVKREYFLLFPSQDACVLNRTEMNKRERHTHTHKKKKFETKRDTLRMTERNWTRKTWTRKDPLWVTQRSRRKTILQKAEEGRLQCASPFTLHPRKSILLSKAEPYHYSLQTQREVKHYSDPQNPIFQWKPSAHNRPWRKWIMEGQILQAIWDLERKCSETDF